MLCRNAGQPAQADIVAAIADALDEGAQDFYSRQISMRVVRAADNQVSDVFKQLHAAGLLIPVEDKGDLLRKRYRARACAYWDLCRAIRDELRAARWTPGEDL